MSAGSEDHGADSESCDQGRPGCHELVVTRAVTAAQWEAARQLIERYAEALDFGLEFQDFDREMRSLPEDYGPPDGCLLLAQLGSDPVGCVALRKFAEGLCEMKRLYVAPVLRGRGAGRSLAEAIMTEARRLGYGRMRLDTVPSMLAARELYASLGFRSIEAYRHNPIAGAEFMELVL